MSKSKIVSNIASEVHESAAGLAKTFLGGSAEAGIGLNTAGEMVAKGSLNFNMNLGKAAGDLSTGGGILSGEAAGAIKDRMGNFLSNRMSDIRRPYDVWKNMGTGMASKEGLAALGGANGIAKTAGTYMGAAMVPRALSGSLNPLVNADGERDVIGIPFI